MLFLSILAPHEHSTETFVYSCFWIAMGSVSLAVIVFFGSEFVDFPRLSYVRPATLTAPAVKQAAQQSGYHLLSQAD